MNNVIPFAPRKTEASPYDRAPVQAALDALLPENGGNIGDVQAAAELLLMFLHDFAEREVEDCKEEDPEFAQIAAEALCNLKIAQAFLEKTPFIAVNDPE